MSFRGWFAVQKFLVGANRAARRLARRGREIRAREVDLARRGSELRARIEFFDYRAHIADRVTESAAILRGIAEYESLERQLGHDRRDFEEALALLDGMAKAKAPLRLVASNRKKAS